MISEEDKYRIKRSASQQKAMLFLIENKIFGDYAGVLLISAILGFLNNKKLPIDKQASDSVQITFFDSEARNIIKLIAFLDSGNSSIINSMDKYQIFEEYAYAGFPILLEKLEIDKDAIEKNNCVINQLLVLKKYDSLVNQLM